MAYSRREWLFVGCRPITRARSLVPGISCLLVACEDRLGVFFVGTSRGQNRHFHGVLESKSGKVNRL